MVARNVYDSNNMGRLKLFGAVLSAMQLDSKRVETLDRERCAHARSH